MMLWAQCLLNAMEILRSYRLGLLIARDLKARIVRARKWQQEIAQ